MDLEGIALRPSAHRTDDRQTSLKGLGNEMGLRRQGVYGVDDVVVAMAVKEFGEGFVLEEGLDCLELE